MDHGSMSMTFVWSSSVTLWLPAWQTTSVASYGATLLFLALLASAQEWLAHARLTSGVAGSRTRDSLLYGANVLTRRDATHRVSATASSLVAAATC